MFYKTPTGAKASRKLECGSLWWPYAEWHWEGAKMAPWLKNAEGMKWIRTLSLFLPSPYPGGPGVLLGPG